MLISFRATMRSSCLSVAIAAALLPCCALAADSAAGAADPLSPHTLDRVQVRGAAPAQGERALTPGAVTVVDGETFYQRAVNNMADSLRYVPGLWTESGTGGDAVFISSRGSNLDATDYDSNGVKLFQDGLPITTADGNNHNRFPDPMAARQVVMARGANALTYGASNLGGAMDFASSTAHDVAPGQLFISGGSFGSLNGRLTAGGVWGDSDGLVTLERKSRDGYRAHSRQDRTSLYANAGWRSRKISTCACSPRTSTTMKSWRAP